MGLVVLRTAFFLRADSRVVVDEQCFFAVHPQLLIRVKTLLHETGLSFQKTKQLSVLMVKEATVQGASSINATCLVEEQQPFSRKRHRRCSFDAGKL